MFDDGYDQSIVVGEIKQVLLATVDWLDYEYASIRHEVLAFSYHHDRGFFSKDLKKGFTLDLEELSEYRALQRYVPIQVTTEDDMEWWWFEDEFYQTRFIKCHPSQLLAEEMLVPPESIPAKYSLNTIGRVEIFPTVDGEVKLVGKLTLDGLLRETETGYSPSEVAQAVFELKNRQETEDQKSKRLQAFFVEKNKQDQESMSESTIQERTQVSKGRREPIPKRIRMYVWQRDYGKCVACGNKEKLEYDHIIPLSRGGGNTERNIQLLCEHCNRSKGGSVS